MFKFIKKLLKNKLRKVTRPVKQFVSFKKRFKKNKKKALKVTARRTKKSIKRKIVGKVTSPKRRIEGKVRQVKGIVRGTHLLISPKARLIKDTFEKGKLSYSLIAEENLFLENKTAVQKDTNVSTKGVAESEKFLKGMSYSEIKKINEVISQELSQLGVNSDKDINKVINDEEFKKDLVQQNAFYSYLEHWKEGFFGYTDAKIGMTEEERIIVWNQIIQDQPYEKFAFEKGPK